MAAAVGVLVVVLGMERMDMAHMVAVTDVMVLQVAVVVVAAAVVA